MATYSPAPPWTDGERVTRISDGIIFTYSKSLNALTVVPNTSGAAKDSSGKPIINVPTPRTGSAYGGDAANRSYVDSKVGITEAPTDGGTYARQNSAWTKIYDGGAY